MFENMEDEDVKDFIENLYRINKSLQEDEDKDMALALSIKEEEDIADAQPSPMAIADPQWELIDPSPDIQALFLELNRIYFANTIEPCTVQWSKRMTSSAGICRFEGHGGLCSIHLSEPLLKFRPRKDLLETLLHEMIHAYLFLAANNRDREEHGPQFHEHMVRINEKSGLAISVYHDFHREVNFHKRHVWQCNGRCANWPPRFGQIKRATNRDPNKDNTPWSHKHKQWCGGSYVKISAPPAASRQLTKKGKANLHPPPKNRDLRDYLKKSDGSARVRPVLGTKVASVATRVEPEPANNNNNNNNVNNNNPDRNVTEQVEEIPEGRPGVRGAARLPNNHGADIDFEVRRINNRLFPTRCQFISCPLCSEIILKADINYHFDLCILACKSVSSIVTERRPRAEMLRRYAVDCNLVNCPICGLMLHMSEIEEHAAQCALFKFDK